MQQPFTRRRFTAAVAALAAGQIARPIAEAQPEPVPVAPGIELLAEAQEPETFPPVSRVLIFAIVMDYDEVDEAGRPKLSTMRVAREGTDMWHLEGAADEPYLNRGLRLDDGLDAAFERLRTAAKSMV